MLASDEVGNYPSQKCAEKTGAEGQNGDRSFLRYIVSESPQISQESMKEYFSTRANDLDLEGTRVSIEELFGEGVAAVA